MYTAGSYADHVTRYNHKVNRWMPDAKPQRPRTMEVAAVLICTVCIAVALTLGVMLLQC